MANNKRLVSLIVIAAVLVGILIYSLNANKGNYYLTNIPSGEESAAKENIIPKATGNVDDIVSALILGAEEEKTILGDATEDKALIVSDSQDISGFSQSADENEF